MYPSKKDKLYGVFVKNMHLAASEQGVKFPYKALIKGRANSFSGKIKKYFAHYFRILTFFFKRDYDIFYVHYFSMHVPLLWLLMPFKKKPWVVNVHGTDILVDLMEHPKLNYLAKKVLKKVDLLVVPSLFFQQKMLNCYPFFAADKIFISPSGGLDLSQFYQDSNARKNTEIMLGFVSRFDFSKGWKTFLEALQLLRQQQILFRALIIGKGPDEEKIRASLRNSGLVDAVEFIGFVRQTELREHYNRMDVYVFPTYRESLGLTGLEAMACGIPIIGSKISAVETFLEDGRNGFFFEPRDAEDLAQKIIDFKALSEENKKDLGRNARKTAENYERTLVSQNLIAKLKTLK